MDYTNYARSAGGFYYTCGGGPAPMGKGVGPLTCYSPVSSWNDHVETTHQSHELRLSTPDDWRLRGLIGAFWEDFDIKDDMNFLYKSFPSCTPANLALYQAGAQVCTANVIPAPGICGDRPDRAQRKCRVRRGPRARLQADGVVHLDRLRPDPEGPDADRRDPLLPLQGDHAGLAVLHQHRLRGYPERRMRAAASSAGCDRTMRLTAGSRAAAT